MQSQGGHLKETKIEVQKGVLKSSQQHLQPSLWLFPVWQFPHQQLKPLLTITMTTPHSLLLLAIGEDPIPQVVQKQTLPVHTSSPILFATEALMCMSMDMTQALALGWIAQIKLPVGSLT